MGRDLLPNEGNGVLLPAPVLVDDLSVVVGSNADDLLQGLDHLVLRHLARCYAHIAIFNPSGGFDNHLCPDGIIVLGRIEVVDLPYRLKTYTNNSRHPVTSLRNAQNRVHGINIEYTALVCAAQIM